MRTHIIIPFYQRYKNLVQVLDSLEKQTCEDFGVSICAFKPDKELETIVSNVTFRCDVIEVLGEEWNVSKARNEGIRHFNNSDSRHLILLDTDIVVDNNFVENHKRQTQSNAVIIGYVEDLVADIEFGGTQKICCTDIRWKGDNPNELKIKWPFGWTANMAICNDLKINVPYFDEMFKGWGAEDLEWTYRLSLQGWKIIFAKDCVGKHLPHKKDVTKNMNTEQDNFGYFFEKWTTYEVEIVKWLNDIQAINWFKQYGNIINKLNVKLWEICFQDHTKILVGFPLDYFKNLDSDYTKKYFIKEYSLLGVCLPYQNKKIDEAIISKKYHMLPKFAYDRIVEEANRVAKVVVSEGMEDSIFVL